MTGLRRVVVKRIRFVTLVGMAINIALTLAKGAGGILFHSQALLADAVHSFSDLATDFAVLIGVRYWMAPPDRSHPYGHGRVETLVTASIGFALALVGLGMLWGAGVTLWRGTGSTPGLPALFIALVSIVSKEWLFRWTRREARRFKCEAMEANAWHHRSDALSSIPAALSIALAGIFPEAHFIDPLGAVVVSIFIFHAAWVILKPALLELSDAEVEKEAARIRELALGVPEIRAVHAIRTRKCGGDILADLHIKVDGDMPVRRGHALSHQVRRAIVEADIGVTDVVIHLEPFD